MKRATLLLAVAAAACSDLARGPTAPETPSDAELRASAPATSQQVGPDDWIVVFQPGVQDAPGLARQLVAQGGGVLHRTYEHALSGFAATLPPQAVEGIRNNPNVQFVEHDGVATIVTEEAAASWGLDRIDQSVGLSGTYVYETEGAGAKAYVIDTGIRYTHVEFEGSRAEFGFDAYGGDGSDCHDHGSHVAGTIGGKTYGVAKSVTLVAVRVLNCAGSGSYGDVIAGVDWVTGDYQNTGTPSVANMSLGGGYSASLNLAVANSVNAGIVYAVAAGNGYGADACDSSPSSERQALTVGSTASSDNRSSFSNVGFCLDLFAPGSAITSATARSDTETATWNGTSMASPHVAGVAALYLGENPSANPTTVKFNILSQATSGVVVNAGTGSPNLLLYSLITGPSGPPPPSAPSDLVATATSSSEIMLSWMDNSTDETGFRLEHSPDGVNFSWLTDVGVDEKTFAHTGLSVGTKLWYRVRAFNADGSSAWSNVASAITDGAPPPSETAAEVWEVSDVAVAQQGKFSYGSVGVTVIEDSGTLLDLLDGVTVSGDWYKNGESAPFKSSSGVTGSGGFPGTVVLETGKVRNASALHFCVTSLSGPGVTDGTEYPKCDGFFTPPDPGEEPEPGAPAGLSASWSQRGGGRIELSWTPGGAAEVDVYRGTSQDPLDPIATSSDNGRYFDRDGHVNDWYQVCAAGTNLCSEVVPVG